MMRHLDHIGIAVADMEAAIVRYESILGVPCYKRERVEGEQVETAFFRTGETKVELLAATSESSVIAGFIAKRGEGMHHMAFDVSDIDAEIVRMLSLGYRMLSEQPKSGADNKRIAFLHPKEAHGVLVELCQSQ